MVELGEANGVRTAALLTDMGTPLGCTAGNALEVAESVEVLAGGGPPDVVELTVALAEVMCELAGLDADPAGPPGLRRSHGHLASRWSPPRAATPTRRLPAARHVETVRAGADGIPHPPGRPGRR